jgi:hypothetical protein
MFVELKATMLTEVFSQNSDSLAAQNLASTWNGGFGVDVVLVNQILVALLL